jgi:transposase InsO family protein
VKLNKEEAMKIDPLCCLFGISRQAYYQRKNTNNQKNTMRSFIIEYVRNIREKDARTGCQKLYVMCENFFGDLFVMGRDAFYNLLREYGMMLRLKKFRVRTTDSSHLYHRYPDLAKGLVPLRPGVLWVADITYIRLSSGKFCFLSLIADAYSHRIMGWRLAPTLEYSYTLEALQSAISAAPFPLEGLVHHSDRGGQYAHDSYISLLRAHGIRSSMTQSGDPRDNAIAERLNGIIKQEYTPKKAFDTMEEVQAALETYIDFYNTERPHASIDFLTPVQAEQMEGELKRRWKSKSRRNAESVNFQPPVDPQEEEENIRKC